MTPKQKGYIEMRCAECGESRLFAPDGEPEDFNDGGVDYTCTHCGWMQTSFAGGCAELCRLATWHNISRYEEFRDLARTGGHDVPDAPPHFLP
jgi:hypothetical protein